MSDTVIKVENLGKKYILSHRQEGRSQYRALRDVIADTAKSFGKKITSPLKNEPTILPEKEEFWALKDISFEIKRGDRVGIIGRNGAGKSTLLKILSRITEPTTGRIQLKRRIASLLEVGTGFHPELTGRENILLNGSILGMSKLEINSKFDEIVSFAEVEKFLDTPVKRYSSGMYVRLAFAVAAHLEPEILIVDEVLAVGDAQFQKKCLGKMKEIGVEGQTVLFVSHNMGAISSLCERAIVLSKGELAFNGDVQNAIATYMVTSHQVRNSNSLISHPNRVPGSEELLTYFSLDAEDDLAYYGHPLTLTIGYDFPLPIAKPQFAISIYTSEGIRAFTLISDYQNNNIPDVLEGLGEVKCRIPSLSLMPGKYFISLKLWQPGMKLDDIENVMNFQVEWLDRNLGQFNWNSSLGVMYVDATWKYNL